LNFANKKFVVLLQRFDLKKFNAMDKTSDESYGTIA
jgi:hypothetical protein